MEQPRKLFRVSSVILGVKHMQKKGTWKWQKNLPWDFKKCPGSLHFTLLVLSNLPRDNSSNSKFCLNINSVRN